MATALDKLRWRAAAHLALSFKESIEPRPGPWTHHMVGEGPADLDDEVRAWLREAYETRGLKDGR